MRGYTTRAFGSRDSRTGRKFVGVAPYERFEAWNQAHQLALAVYRVTQSFPRHELYGLTSQARRAAFSVAANIAEGSAKRGGREFARFLDIALGSLSELSYILLLVRDLELLPRAVWDELDRIYTNASKTTWGLYSAVRRNAGRITHANRPTA